MPHGSQLGRASLGVAVAAIVLTACASSPVAKVTSPARPTTTATTAAAAAGSPQPYQLYTHCGIAEARIGNRYFEAVHPLSDGQGNPPPGWGNPYQQGTMTLLSPAEAVFRDDAGHQVQFRLRPGAITFEHLCS
jgi:hypothetical protein